MTRDQALEHLLELKSRIANLVSRGPPGNWHSEWEIVRNDLDEFVGATFTDGSTDASAITSAVHPALEGGTESWSDLIQDARYVMEALDVVERRLTKGQSQLKSTPDDEIVIDANTPYTAYARLRDIVEAATAGLLIVDPYINRDLLTLLTNVTPGVQTRILTSKSRTPPDLMSEAAKFTAQHGIPVEVRWGSEDFHDRFLLVDDRLYMSGGSFKDLGKRLSLITEVQSTRDVLVAELEKRWLAGAKA